MKTLTITSICACALSVVAVVVVLALWPAAPVDECVDDYEMTQRAIENVRDLPVIGPLYARVMELGGSTDPTEADLDFLAAVIRSTPASFDGLAKESRGDGSDGKATAEQRLVVRRHAIVELAYISETAPHVADRCLAVIRDRLNDKDPEIVRCADFTLHPEKYAPTPAEPLEPIAETAAME